MTKASLADIISHQNCVKDFDRTRYFFKGERTRETGESSAWQSKTSVDVRQQAGHSEGTAGQETPAGTGEKPKRTGNTGNETKERPSSAGNERPGGGTAGAGLPHTGERPGVQRRPTGTVVSGRPDEGVGHTGAEGGVEGQTPREETTTRTIIACC